MVKWAEVCEDATGKQKRSRTFTLTQPNNNMIPPSRWILKDERASPQLQSAAWAF